MNECMTQKSNHILSFRWNLRLKMNSNGFDYFGDQNHSASPIWSRFEIISNCCCFCILFHVIYLLIFELVCFLCYQSVSRVWVCANKAMTTHDQPESQREKKPPFSVIKPIFECAHCLTIIVFLSLLLWKMCGWRKEHQAFEIRLLYWIKLNKKINWIFRFAHTIFVFVCHNLKLRMLYRVYTFKIVNMTANDAIVSIKLTICITNTHTYVHLQCHTPAKNVANNYHSFIFHTIYICLHFGLYYTFYFSLSVSLFQNKLVKNRIYYCNCCCVHVSILFLSSKKFFIFVCKFLFVCSFWFGWSVDKRTEVDLYINTEKVSFFTHFYWSIVLMGEPHWHRPFFKMLYIYRKMTCLLNGLDQVYWYIPRSCLY